MSDRMIVRRYVEFIEGYNLIGEAWRMFELRRYEENDLGERFLVGRQHFTPDEDGTYSISPEPME